MVSKDEWLSAAMANDSVVVELLVRLKQSQASSSSAATVIPARWGLRQRRSRIISPSRYDPISHKNKDSSSTRCSPTTPLSWTSENSCHSSRSKGYGTNEFSCSTSMAKRLKRRKEFAGLRVEESLLLKERVHLKKVDWLFEQQLESLHATFKEQTSNNEKLKKMKINLNFDTSSNSVWDESKPVASNQPCQSVDPIPDNVPTTLPMLTARENSTQSESNKTREINSMESGGFFLPDLNMIPVEDCLGGFHHRMS